MDAVLLAPTATPLGAVAALSIRPSFATRQSVPNKQFKRSLAFYGSILIDACVSLPVQLVGGNLTATGYSAMPDPQNHISTESLSKWLPRAELVYGRGATGARYILIFITITQPSNLHPILMP